MRAMLLALVAGLGLLANASTTQAQTQAAVIDMGAVFDAHPQFKQQVEALKNEVAQFDQYLKTEQESVMSEAKTLQASDPSSDQFRTGEAQLASRTANLEVQRRLKAKEFAQREAKIYYDVYLDVSRKVSDYCKQKQINTVVHFNSKAMSTSDPSSIMARMNSNVVYHREDANITNAIIQLCSGQARQVEFQQPAGQ